MLCTLCFVLCKIDNQVGQPETALRGKKHKKFPMPKLTLLGTGTPTPLPHRAGSGYLVTLDREMLMVDCVQDTGGVCWRPAYRPRRLPACCSPICITIIVWIAAIWCFHAGIRAVERAVDRVLLGTPVQAYWCWCI